MSDEMNTHNYQNNLDKWQTSTHPDLADCKPEDLFQPEFAEHYHHFHNDLWQRIIRLHGTLYTLDQLKDFPFSYLYSPGSMEFWRLVWVNFFEMSIVILHGLVNDNGEATHTIPKFTNEIANNNKKVWLDENMCKLFHQKLKEVKFNKTIDKIANRVTKIRHTYIAHRLHDEQNNQLINNVAGIKLKELLELFDKMHAKFGAISFGSSYVTLKGDLIPSTTDGRPNQTCLDKVLDAVLRDSAFVNQPEMNGRFWSVLCEHMRHEELEVMNQCRNRVGLPVKVKY